MTALRDSMLHDGLFSNRAGQYEARLKAAEQRAEAAEAEIERLNSRDPVGGCQGCLGTIWSNEARIGQDGKTWHPVCIAIKRAEAAEEKVRKLLIELNRAFFFLSDLPVPQTEIRRLIEEIIDGAIEETASKGTTP